MPNFGDFIKPATPGLGDYIVGYNAIGNAEQKYNVSDFFTNVNSTSSYNLSGVSLGSLVRNSQYSQLSASLRNTFDYYNSQATYAIPGGVIIKGQSPSYDTSIRNLPDWGVYGLQIQNVNSMDPGTTFVNDGRGNSTHAFTFRAGINNFTSGSDHSHVSWSGAPNNPSQTWQMIQGGQNGAYDNRFMVHTLPQYQLTTTITAQNGGYVDTTNAGLVTGTDRLTGVKVQVIDPAGTNNYWQLGINDYVGLVFNPGVAGLVAAAYNGRVTDKTFASGLSTFTMDLYIGVSTNWVPAQKGSQFVSLSSRTQGGNPGVNYITSTIGEPSTDYVGLTGNYRNLPKHVLARFTSNSIISGFKTGAPITLWVPNGMTPSNLIYGGPSSPGSRYGFFDAYVRTISNTDMEIVLGSLIDQYNFNTYSNNVTAAGNAGYVLIGGSIDTVHRPTFGTTGFYFEREPWTSGSANWLSGGLIKNTVLGCSESFGNYSYGLGHRGVTMGNYAGTFAGDGNIVTGNYSVAIGGRGLTVESSNQAVVGRFNAPAATSLFVVGGGTSDTNRNNALEVDSTGYVGIRGTVATLENFAAAKYIIGDIIERPGNSNIPDVSDFVLDGQETVVTSNFGAEYFNLTALVLPSYYNGAPIVGGSYQLGMKFKIYNFLNTSLSHVATNLLVKSASGSNVGITFNSGGITSTVSGIWLSAGYSAEFTVFQNDSFFDGSYFLTKLEKMLDI